MDDDDLDRALTRIVALTQQLQHALAAGDEKEAARLLQQLQQAERVRDKALGQTRDQPRRQPTSQPTNQPTSQPTSRSTSQARARIRRQAATKPPQVMGLMTPAAGAPSSPAPRTRSRRTTPQARDLQEAATAERPLRELVLETLTLLGRPAPIKLIVDVARAREGVHLPAGRLTNLRRDDERSFTSASTRAAYVVPALTHDRFTPVRGTLANSAWPLPVRINAPASGRVDFLHAVAAIAADTTSRQKAGADATGARILLWRLSHSIPDAVVLTGGASLDPRRVRRAALAELALHEEADTAEREEAAERAEQQLSAVELLFGARPGVVRNRTKEA